MKVLAGDNEELSKIIPVLLGCKKEDPTEGNYLDLSKSKHVVHLMKETAYSHLMEVRHFTYIGVFYFSCKKNKYYQFKSLTNLSECAYNF